VQRHRIALLALLSAAGSQGVPRERLLGYLWPESPESRARRLLSESVYVLRKALGAELVNSDGDVLCLSRDRLRVDVLDFEAAVGRGDPARAVELYAGPFLDGFYLEQAVELERWIERERSRLAGLYLQALRDLAREAAGRREWGAAVAWWRRAAAQEPTNSGIARELMLGLEAAGDVAGAVLHARVHARLLGEELGMEADPAVERLAEEIQGRRTAAADREDPERRPLPDDEAPPVGASPPAPAPAAVEAMVDAVPRNVPPSRVGGRRGRRSAAVVVSLLALLALAGLYSAGRPGRAEPEPPEAANTRLVVLPFVVRGAPELNDLGQGVMELLSAQVDELGTLRPVSPRTVLAGLEERPASGPVDDAADEAVATRLQARYYIVGEVVAVASRLRLVAALHEVGSPRPLATAAVDGTVDDIFVSVDRLGIELLTRADRSPSGRLARVAGVTTTSLPAFRAFLRGENALHNRSRVAAIDALEEAVREDSTFALAHYRLSVVAEAAIRPELAEKAADAAFRHRGRLPGRYRRLVEASHAWRRGDVETAERMHGELVATYPDEVEAWSGLGEVLFHANPLRGRGLAESRTAWERVLALEPDHLAALNHLVRIAAMQGDAERTVRLATRIQQEDPGSAQALEARVLGSLARGAAGGHRDLPDDLGAARPASLLYLAWMTAGLMQDPASALRLTEPLRDPARPADVRASGLILQAYLEAAQGRWRAANSLLAEADRLEPAAALHARAILATLPHSPVPAAELERIRGDLLYRPAHATPGAISAGPSGYVNEDFYPVLRYYLLGRIEARLGHRGAALSHADTLQELGVGSHSVPVGSVLAAGLRGRVRGDGEKAPIYGSRFPSPLSGISYQFANRSPVLSQADERYHHARALEEAGRAQEALAWYGTIAEGARFDFVYLAPAHLRQAEIYEKLGKKGEALHHYGEFLRLWERSDPELRPLVLHAARRRAALLRA